MTEHGAVRGASAPWPPQALRRVAADLSDETQRYRCAWIEISTVSEFGANLGVELYVAARTGAELALGGSIEQRYEEAFNRADMTLPHPLSAMHWPPEVTAPLAAALAANPGFASFSKETVGLVEHHLNDIRLAPADHPLIAALRAVQQHGKVLNLDATIALEWQGHGLAYALQRLGARSRRARAGRRRRARA